MFSDTMGAGIFSGRSMFSDTMGAGIFSGRGMFSDTMGAGIFSGRGMFSDTMGAGGLILKNGCQVLHIDRGRRKHVYLFKKGYNPPPPQLTF